MIDNKLIIFTNNKRSINVINFLKKKFKIELIVSLFKKTNKELLTKLRKLKIPILFLDKDKKIYDKIKLVNPSFIICAGFTKIIPKKILDQAKISSINLHGGRVPTYLGASTLNWQIINNEKYIYISALKMNSKIDGGPLIVEKKIKINRDEYVDDVQKKINLLFPKLCLKAINKQLTKAKMTFYPKKQKIFWRQRNKNDSIIDIKNLNCLEIYNRIRASSPKFYPAFIIRKRFKYLLFKAHLKNYKSTHGSKKIIVKNDRLLINCSKKYLLIKSFKRIKRLK